uniref:Uncharacterized protein n=1 Tax=Arcella intermedia TaxID=1963864 RepID=A0A6B2LR88_9EUKA
MRLSLNRLRGWSWSWNRNWSWLHRLGGRGRSGLFLDLRRLNRTCSILLIGLSFWSWFRILRLRLGLRRSCHNRGNLNRRNRFRFSFRNLNDRWGRQLLSIFNRTR